MIFEKDIVAVMFLLLSTVYATEWWVTPRKHSLIGKDYRLNNDIIPINYNLEIKLDNGFELSRHFKGRVEITLSLKPGVVQTGKPINLHMQNITVEGHHGIILRSDKNNKNLLDNIPKPNEELEMITLQPTETLISDTKYILTVLFTGNIQNSVHGFYLSSYLNKDGNTE